MKQDVRTLLEEMLPAIKRIDGGCKSCISDFCSDVNDVINDKYNLSLDVVIGKDYSIDIVIKEF